MREMKPGDLLRSGDLDAAASLARELLVSDPHNADALHTLGVHALSSGAIDAACAHLESATTHAPETAWYWCNLGHARLQQAKSGPSDFDASIRASRHALELNPDYAQARYNLACALLESDRLDEANNLFRQLTERYPEQADYACALGDAERQAGHWRAAMRCYRKALENDADHVRAESNLGALLAAFGDAEKALTHCRRAVEKAPQSWQAHRLLGRCLVQNESFDEAMHAYADAFELQPDSTELCVDIARVWQENGDLGEAASWYQRALGIAVNDPAARAGLASILLDQGHSARALGLLNEIIEVSQDSVEALRVHAQCLWQEGDAESGIAQVRKAQALQPQNANLYALSGQILASSGDVEQAHAEHLRALELNPRSIPALSGLATSQKGSLDPTHLQSMNRLLETPQLRDGASASLHAGLAQVHDGLKDWQTAAMHMAAANASQWRQREKRDQAYDRDEHARRCAKIREVFSAEFLARNRVSANPSEEPAFIVGMPRSGTTLTEQILARHARVLGIGERNFAAQSLQALAAASARTDEVPSPDPLDLLDTLDDAVLERVAGLYLEELDGLKRSLGKSDAKRVVDKMPDNYSLIGWIAMLFPRARIIHCRRDLRDVALSCWLTQFGKIQWASRWPDLLHRIEHYQDLMQHWRTVLPGRFIEVDYESMVVDQEVQSRRLVDWLGLEWDPSCLEHYAGDTLVRTASITQVRQPIYTRSVARWKAYLPWIPELGEIDIDRHVAPTQDPTRLRRGA
jgi:tetratricopeptide (TPR) repeat protein